MVNPVVFFDVSIGGKAAGRIVFTLFAGNSLVPYQVFSFDQTSTTTFNLLINALPSYHRCCPKDR